MSNAPVNTDSPATPPPKAAKSWTRHPVDVRLSLPFFKWRFYLTLIGGAEQRAPERRASDRAQFPIATVGNLIFGFGIVTCFAMLALVALIAQSAIIEM